MGREEAQAGIRRWLSCRGHRPRTGLQRTSPGGPGETCCPDPLVGTYAGWGWGASALDPEGPWVQPPGCRLPPCPDFSRAPPGAGSAHARRAEERLSPRPATDKDKGARPGNADGRQLGKARPLGTGTGAGPLTVQEQQTGRDFPGRRAHGVYPCTGVLSLPVSLSPKADPGHPLALPDIWGLGPWALRSWKPARRPGSPPAPILLSVQRTKENCGHSGVGGCPH